LDVICF